MKFKKLENLLTIMGSQYAHILGENALETLSLENVVELIVDYYENIIRCMPGNVYWLDKNCITLGCNQNVLDMHQFKSLKEFKGLSFEEMGRLAHWSKEATQSFKKDTLEVIKNGKPKLNIEEPPIPGPDGRMLYFLTSRVPLFDRDENVIGVVGISVDITDRKLAEESEKQAIAKETESKIKAEAEEQLRQAVTIISGSIAHDLRTPISIINMDANQIKKFMSILINAYHKAKEANLITEEIQENLLEHLAEIGSSILEEAKGMQEFISTSLRSLSKAIAGDMSPENLMPCSMDKCIDQTVRRYPFTPDEQKLIKWDRKPDFTFMGNEILMIRILSNLIKNALEQIRQNKRGEIFITTEKGKKENLLRIKDTAGGAPPEVVEHLFEGYKTTKKGGTGIGLSFSKKLMKDFGGDITCNSKYGEYIEFVLTFPAIAEKS